MKKKSFARSDRICEQIRRDLSELIRSEIKDPRVGMVSLTAVELTPDYAHAKVFLSTLSPAQVPDTLKGLQRAAGFLRHALGQQIHLHTLPQLHFVYDDSMGRGSSRSQLIDAAVAVSNQTPQTPDEG